MKFFLIAVFCFLKQIKALPQWETGNFVGNNDENGNLALGNTADRFETYTVVFTKIFTVIPKVALSTSLIDLASTGAGYRIDLGTVTLTGFTLSIYALTTAAVNRILCDWLATEDPMVFVQYYSFSNVDLDTIATSSSSVTQPIVRYVNINLNGYQLNCAKTSQVYINGFRLYGSNEGLVQVMKDSVTATYIRIVVTSSLRMDSLKVCIIASDSIGAASYVQWYTAPTSHAWYSSTMSVTSSSRYQNLNTQTLPASFLCNQFGFLIGISKVWFVQPNMKASVGVATVTGGTFQISLAASNNLNYNKFGVSGKCCDQTN